MNPTTTNRQKAIYDGKQAGYVPVYADGAAFKALMRSQIERARLQGRFGTSLKAVRNAKEIAHLDLQPGQRVLDCGCGGGILINQLVARYGVHGAGVDVSKLALSRARTAGSKAIVYKLGALEKLPFADKSFDAVVSFDVLEHVEGKPRAVAEIVRVLKPGGRALLYAVSSRDALTWHWWLRALTFGRFGHDTEAGHSPELMASPFETKRQFQVAGARVLRLSFLHSFFTLAVDELGSWWQKRRPAAVVGVKTGRNQGSGTDGIYRVLQWLEPVLDLLEWPWKLLGLGNGFFVLVEKQ